MLADLASWVEDVIEALGYLGVALLVVLENVFPPIPSEVVLPFAGFAAARGDASVVGMVVAATIGSVVGAWVLYGIAAAIGPERLHRFVVRSGRWFGVKEDDVSRSERWFDERANVAVLVGRCVPLVRSLISIPAGFRRMKPLPFTLYTTIGSAVWNLALIGAGAALGSQWERVGPVLETMQAVVIAAIVAALLRLGWVLVRRRRA